VFSTEEVIGICDLIIETVDNPPYEIIEASLMTGAKSIDLEDKLSEFHILGYNENIVKALLSIIDYKFSNNKMDVAEAVRCSSRLLLHSGLSFEREYYNLYNIEDMYDLAECGTYGDLKDVEKEFKLEISTYSKYLNDFRESFFELFKKELIL